MPKAEQQVECSEDDPRLNQTIVVQFTEVLYNTDASLVELVLVELSEMIINQKQTDNFLVDEKNVLSN